MCGLETSLGRNHHFWCPPPPPLNPFISSVRDRQLSLGWECYRRPPFIGDPQHFIRDPTFSSETLNFSWGEGGGRIFSLGTRYKHLYRYISRINEREEYFNNCSICNSKVQHLFIQFQRMFQIFDNSNYKNSSGSSNNS